MDYKVKLGPKDRMTYGQLEYINIAAYSNLRSNHLQATHLDAPTQNTQPIGITCS
jgi:hypothetical protein